MFKMSGSFLRCVSLCLGSFFVVADLGALAPASQTRQETLQQATESLFFAPSLQTLIQRRVISDMPRTKHWVEHRLDGSTVEVFRSSADSWGQPPWGGDLFDRFFPWFQSSPKKRDPWGGVFWKSFPFGLHPKRVKSVKSKPLNLPLVIPAPKPKKKTWGVWEDIFKTIMEGKAENQKARVWVKPGKVSKKVQRQFEPYQPRMWKVKSPDGGTLYLLGTEHRTSSKILPKPVWDALNQAHTYCGEILSNLDLPINLGFLGLTSMDYELEEYARKKRKATMYLDRMEPWKRERLARLEEQTRGWSKEREKAEIKLLYKRNRDWVHQLNALMAQGGVSFVAVGLAHLADEYDYSVPELMKALGYEVEEVPIYDHVNLGEVTPSFASRVKTMSLEQVLDEAYWDEPKGGAHRRLLEKRLKSWLMNDVRKALWKRIQFYQMVLPENAYYNVKRYLRIMLEQGLGDDLLIYYQAHAQSLLVRRVLRGLLSDARMASLVSKEQEAQIRQLLEGYDADGLCYTDEHGVAYLVTSFTKSLKALVYNRHIEDKDLNDKVRQAEKQYGPSIAEKRKARAKLADIARKQKGELVASEYKKVAHLVKLLSPGRVVKSKVVAKERRPSSEPAVKVGAPTLWNLLRVLLLGEEGKLPHFALNFLQTPSVFSGTLSVTTLRAMMEQLQINVSPSVLKLVDQRTLDLKRVNELGLNVVLFVALIELLRKARSDQSKKELSLDDWRSILQTVLSVFEGGYHSCISKKGLIEELCSLQDLAPSEVSCSSFSLPDFLELASSQQMLLDSEVLSLFQIRVAA